MTPAFMRVYGMTPGQSAWYTDLASVEASRYTYTSLYGGLQIRPHETYGYRNQITVYEVMEDVTAPMGQALANRAYGPGGYTQYYIEGFQSKLRPITTLQLSR